MRRAPQRRSRSLGIFPGLMLLVSGVGAAMYFRLTPPEPVAAVVREYAAKVPFNLRALQAWWKPGETPGAEAERDLLADIDATDTTAPSEPQFEAAAPLEDSVAAGQSEPPIQAEASVPGAASTAPPQQNPTYAGTQQSAARALPPQPSVIEQAGYDVPAALPAAASPSPANEQPLGEIDALIQAGDFIAAHRELSKLYWNEPESHSVIAERIETTARSIFFSPQPHYMEPYEVQPGDQLQQVATHYQVPWEYLARLNHVDPRKVRTGQKLKVIKGPFSALIDLSDFELAIHAHGYYVHSYRVGIGKEGTTPLGTFTVQTKLVNPTYYGPDGLVIDADDPVNPLGERWIDIGDSYGIHGTIEPESIGRAESKGCIRLLNAEAEEVYDLLGVGSQVVIRR